jgi:peptidoglycan/xylan/chitin deacetylase (PgdA/CDA1 family)
MVNVVVAIDDLHPEQGWGCEGDVQVDYLKSLNDEFGVKFTLFCPSNYHRQYELTKDWVDFWLQYDWVELANHGHYHEVRKYTEEQLGQQEFLELNYQEAFERIQDSIDTWSSCGYKPKGFRSPGWGITQEAADAVSPNFQWVAQHENINKDIQFKCKTFYGEDGIHETENLRLYGNTFMFQSHIQGDWNDNIWNKKNYLHFQKIVKYLLSEYNGLQFKTISEL